MCNITKEKLEEDLINLTEEELDIIKNTIKIIKKKK